MPASGSPISRYFQNYTIPFIIVIVPQHRIPVMPGVFRLCAVLLAYPYK